MTALSFNPHRPKLEPDKPEFLDPSELEIGTLYSGDGGNVGRVAILKDMTPDTISYQGFLLATNSLVLKAETRELESYHGHYFRAEHKITEVPADLEGELLLEWLVKQELTHTASMLVSLEDSAYYRGKEADIKRYRQVQKLLLKYSPY